MQSPPTTDAVKRDEDIVALLAAQRPREAFDRLMQRYEAKIYRLCLSLVRERSLAEDAAQEAILRIWKALANFDSRAALSTWIYTITRNRCLSAIEKRTKRRAREQSLPDEVELAAKVPPGNDRHELLRRLVEALPERYARSIALYYYEECSVSETAAMLGLPDGTVKTNLARGRALLLEKLGALGLTDTAFWLEEAL